MRAFCGLHLVAVIGKALVIFERLRAKFDAVNKKDNLVGILGVGNELVMVLPEPVVCQM